MKTPSTRMAEIKDWPPVLAGTWREWNSLTADGDGKWCSRFGKQFGGFSKSETYTYHWPGCPTLVFTQRTETPCPQRTVHNNDPPWTRSPNWKRPKYRSTGELINKLCYVDSTEYYSAIKRNGLLKYRTTWLNLKIMLSKRNETQKTPYCAIPLI